MKKLLAVFLLCFVSSLAFTFDIDLEQENQNQKLRYYGYNKIESKNFTIIYEPAFEETAFEVYTYCDEIYEDLAEFFQVRPGRTKIILHGRTSSANGSYSPMPEHINLYVTSPTDFFLGARTESWIKALLIHEMTHFFHVGYEDGFFYALSKVFGDIVKAAPSAFQPGWMIEGITTNTETIFTKGGRGRNPFFELQYKALILEQNMFSYKQAAYASNFEPYGRIYVAGYILIEHILRNYGYDAFVQIHKESIRNPLAPYKVIERVIGKPVKRLYDDLKEELVLDYKYAFDLPKNDIVSPFREASWGRIFPVDNKWIIYRTDPDMGSAIVEFDPYSKEEKIIRKLSLTDRYSIDVKVGQALISLSETDYAHPTGSYSVSDLYFLDLEKGSLKRLTNNRNLWHPVYFGDNQAIAVQRNNAYYDLVMVDLETGDVETLFSESQVSALHPSVSPDLSKVVFTVNTRGIQDLWTYDFSEKKASPLTGPSSSCEYFSRFIDDDNLLFSSDKEGDLRLYKYCFSDSSFFEICQDRVAAFDGLLAEDVLFYNSYSTLGYTLKKAQLQDKDFKQVYFEADLEYSDPVEIKSPDKIKKYYDYPEFVAWTPLPLHLNIVNPYQSDFGIGLGLFAISPVTGNNLQFLVSNSYNNFQPNIFLDTNFRIWRFPSRFSFKNYYTKTLNKEDASLINYNQITNLKFDMDFPLYYTSIGSEHFRLKYSFGINYHYLMSKNEDFKMFDVPNYSIEGFEQEHSLEFSNGLSFVYQQSSSRRNLYPGNYLAFSLRNLVSAPIVENDVKTITMLGLETGIETFKKQNLSFHFTFAYSNFNNVLYAFTSNNFAPSMQLEKGNASFTLAYSFNIAEFDLPLFWTLNWQAIGARVYISTNVKFDFDDSVVGIDPYLYFGLELTNLIGFAQAVFPLKLGVAFRVDMTGTYQFDPVKDIAPIFAIDLSQYLGMSKKGDRLLSIKEQSINNYSYRN